MRLRYDKRPVYVKVEVVHVFWDVILKFSGDFFFESYELEMKSVHFFYDDLGCEMIPVHDDPETVWTDGQLTSLLEVFVPPRLNQQRLAKWHVRVSKQSCKQGNHLILWGVCTPRHFLFRFFFNFFFKMKIFLKKLEKI